MSPRAGLDVCGKSRPYRDSIPEPSYFSKISQQITDIESAPFSVR